MFIGGLWVGRVYGMPPAAGHFAILTAMRG